MKRRRLLLTYLLLVIVVLVGVTACDEVAGVVEQAQATGEAVIEQVQPTVEAAVEAVEEASEEASEEAPQEPAAEEPAAEEPEAEHEEDVHWSYEGESGPEFWGSLSADYETCATGTEQSPVDITPDAVIYADELPIDYRSSNLNIFYNGHTVQVKYDPGSTIQVDEASYRLDQFHFHTPSEHSGDGQQGDMELHLVHRKVDDENMLAVVGVLIVRGAENPAFAPIVQNLPTVQTAEPQTIPDVTVDAAALLPPETSYFRYDGSLTTPDCSQGVKWHVMNTTIEMSDAQISALEEIMGANNRPVQPMNEREFLSPEASEEAGAEHAAGGHWTYEGATGPDHWAVNYPDCAGSLQSPIDVSSTLTEDLVDIIFNYGESPLKILNNGHTIEVQYIPGSTIELPEITYDLQQFHFHSPSEHAVAGVQADAEMHLVHQAANGDRAVVGVLIFEGAENPAFASVWANLPTDVITSEEEKAALEPVPDVFVNALDLLPGVRTYYAYPGSLTTPPCTENVTWLLLTTPIEMSAEQLAAFRAIIEPNNRPVQPLNGRDVLEDTDGG